MPYLLTRRLMSTHLAATWPVVPVPRGPSRPKGEGIVTASRGAGLTLTAQLRPRSCGVALRCVLPGRSLQGLKHPPCLITTETFGEASREIVAAPSPALPTRQDANPLLSKPLLSSPDVTGRRSNAFCAFLCHPPAPNCHTSHHTNSQSHGTAPALPPLAWGMRPGALCVAARWLLDFSCTAR
jgi:hypothetical protein